jgi:predicted 3-demethylubiquinone-9 3-methyltransferase (glyoxalase superfamily)
MISDNIYFYQYKKRRLTMHKVTPFLWFKDQAEEATNFYVSIFKNSKVDYISRGPDGKAFITSFSLDGQPVMALNGGPEFKFTEAISLFVTCETQEEVDYFWNALTADGGEEGPCGWLKDKFGLSWQIVPTALGELMGSAKSPEQAARVNQAMLKMKKLIIADLQRAYDQA